MKKKVNVVKLILNVVLVILTMLDVFFVLLFAINPVAITMYIILGITLTMIATYLLFTYIGKACIRRYKQKMILHQVRVTDKINVIRMREIEEY